MVIAAVGAANRRRGGAESADAGGHAAVRNAVAITPLPRWRWEAVAIVIIIIIIATAVVAVVVAEAAAARRSLILFSSFLLLSFLVCVFSEDSVPPAPLLSLFDYLLPFLPFFTTRRSSDGGCRRPPADDDDDDDDDDDVVVVASVSGSIFR